LDSSVPQICLLCKSEIQDVLLDGKMNKHFYSYHIFIFMLRNAM